MTDTTPAHDTPPLHARLTALAALETLLAELREKTAAARSALLVDMTRHYDETHSPTIVLSIEGRKVGQATIDQPKPKPYVADPNAFCAWMALTDPESVETIIQVRPNVQTAVLAAAKEGNDGEAVDPRTGEVIPGVRIRPAGAPGKFTISGRNTAALLAAVETGGLTGLLADVEAVNGQVVPGQLA